MSRTDTTPKTSRLWAALFSFPNPVNEVSARLVAGGVLVMCLLTIGLNLKWATAVITYGFVARVLTGPSLSPLGQLMTRVVTPRLHVAARPVAGPPKRFAQGIGVVFSGAALVLTVLGYWGAAQIVLGLLSLAAFLESALGICLGCKAFAVLMRIGVVPQDVCVLCTWQIGCTRVVLVGYRTGVCTVLKRPAICGNVGMPRWTLVERAAVIWSSWSSFWRAPARLIWRPSASPSHPWFLASAMRAIRLSRTSMNRPRWARSGRSSGQRTQACSWMHGVA
jgi:hypothetical protein